MRPHQWVKNCFVLAPLVFSRNLASETHLVSAALAALAFCLGSGAVYIINDILDREGDRAHPAKCTRPIASGRLPVPAARIGALGLLAVGLGGGFILEPWFALVLGSYVALNLAYSVRLKHVVFLDVTIIASGFLLRVLGGAVAIDVRISTWLVVCTFLLALYLALGKRKHELVTLGGGTSSRRVLAKYRLEHVQLAMASAALVTAISYSAYTFDPHTVAQFQTTALPLTIPFIAVGLWRFYVLTQDNDFASPTELLLRDIPFIANIVCWGVVTLGLIYL